MTTKVTNSMILDEIKTFRFSQEYVKRDVEDCCARLLQFEQTLNSIKPTIDAIIKVQSFVGKVLDKASALKRKVESKVSPEPCPLIAREREAIRGGNRVLAIKHVRERTGLALVPAKELVEKWWVHCGGPRRRDHNTGMLVNHYGPIND